MNTKPTYDLTDPYSLESLTLVLLQHGWQLQNVSWPHLLQAQGVSHSYMSVCLFLVDMVPRVSMYTDQNAGGVFVETPTAYSDLVRPPDAAQFLCRYVKPAIAVSLVLTAFESLT
jgi:hypothetical protein